MASSRMQSVNILPTESNRHQPKVQKNGMRHLTRPKGRDSGGAKTGLESGPGASLLSVSHTHLHLLSQPSAFPCSTVYQPCGFGISSYFSIQYEHYSSFLTSSSHRVVRSNTCKLLKYLAERECSIHLGDRHRHHHRRHHYHVAFPAHGESGRRSPGLQKSTCYSLKLTGTPTSSCSAHSKFFGKVL